MSESADKKLKFMNLYELLMQQLESGELSAGERIPSERILADKSGISYMTARQAVQTLVDKGYLVRKPRIGTFVPFDIKDRLSMPTINVIMPDSEHNIARQFDRVIHLRMAESRLNMNLVRITNKNIDASVRLLEDIRRPCVVLMSDFVRVPAFRDAMLANPNVVMVGYNLSGIGVKSVLCDDASAARIACSMLQRAGHKNIALSLSDVTEMVSLQIISGWRGGMIGMDADKEASLLIDIGRHGKISSVVEKIVARLLRKGGLPFSAIITSDPEIGLAFSEAFRSVGMNVPHDVSIVTLGLAEFLPHYNPRLTCVDVHLDKQVTYAVQAAQKMLGGKQPDMLHLVNPEIVNGETVFNLE